jgi:hypothetical protein
MVWRITSRLWLDNANPAASPFTELFNDANWNGSQPTFDPLSAAPIP